jgi:purine-binding chemotaxis protein CheW
VSGFLTFVMGGRDLAAPLDQVREIIRAVGVQPLRGVRAPVTGLVELRGDPLPVVDLREQADPGGSGDVVVMAPGVEGPVGIAVDRVLAVVEAAAFVSDTAPRPVGLPGYVLEVLRTADQAHRPVLLVDLRLLAGLAPSPPSPPAAARDHAGTAVGGGPQT